ncbi:MAG: ABC transporter permease [Acidobacteriota bacterium]|nr:ABC transporter permease [Acidobacteriota bacterium]
MNSATKERADRFDNTDPAQNAAVTSPSLDTKSFLPDKPVVIIKPSKSWLALNFRELWAYRELLYFLTWRDVKVRYKQAVFGAGWAILQPLFLMMVFTIFYGRLAGIDTGAVPYPLFALAGLVLWTFFSNAVSGSGNSVVNNTNLITKVYFPRMIVPAASVGACVVDFLLAFVLLVGLMFYYGVSPTRHLLLLPGLVVFTTVFALGVGMWLSALNVKYRDVRFTIPFIMQLWLFISSVIIPSSVVPEKWRWLLLLNPMSGFIEGFRASLFGHPFDWRALALATSITLAVLVYSAFEFRRMEKDFADIV